MERRGELLQVGREETPHGGGVGICLPSREKGQVCELKYVGMENIFKLAT